MSLRDKVPPEEMAAARQRYAIDRVAEALVRAVDDSDEYAGNLSYDDAYTLVRALDAAGRLGSPAHDAAVAAKALRDFATGTRFPNDWVLFRHSDGSVVTVPDLLRETADRIEREGVDR